jgi:hypothetical protein
MTILPWLSYLFRPFPKALNTATARRQQPEPLRTGQDSFGSGPKPGSGPKCRFYAVHNRCSWKLGLVCGQTSARIPFMKKACEARLLERFQQTIRYRHRLHGPFPFPGSLQRPKRDEGGPYRVE